MGKKTGNPRGRPKGAKSQYTVERERKVEETARALEDVLPAAFKGDAHAFLMAVYKDTANPIKDRLAAATAAIGYEKPKLAAIEHSGEMTLTHEQALAELEEAEASMNGHEPAH
ncbi:hypothetical protein [Hyphomicrobium sp. DMF-1]|uniref:hypothetical protein n=1 Tax=Hyphomicrobium sp. DMF-1 TaxID=3019544 RepID=UPI0022EBC6EE|nr:hypothetical protein [Hyphomicrobium sp. DMF-1]WBT40156.1 hypothetical protein PE058_09820 [Hyphomicrobium sp. DMF-1]